MSSMRTWKSGIVVSLLILAWSLLHHADLLYASGIREAAVAGQFYPGTKRALSENVQNLLQKAPWSGHNDTVAALISPHAGYPYSGLTAAYGYNALKGTSIQTVILLGPTHHAGFHGLSIPDVDAYRTPLGEVPLDTAICKTLKQDPLINTHSSAHQREHSLEVQLPFLQTLLEEFKIVPILVGSLDEQDYPKLARTLSAQIKKENTLIIASSDFTHYGPRFQYLPFKTDVKEKLSGLDQGAFQNVLDVDSRGFLDYKSRTGDTICGFRPIALLLEILSGQGVRDGKLLHYTTSGAVTGDFTNSVSYASILFNRRDQTMYLTPDEKKTLLRLAREALESYVRESIELTSPPEGMVLTDRLKEPAGAFVTLEKEKMLRGCIGYIEPIRPLYQAVMDNAVSACAKDYRFPPVKVSELSQIELEVSVLTPKQEIQGPEEFIPEQHGIIIEKNGKRAVFLPHVAKEQGWNREQTLQHLCRKAGLSLDAWKTNCRFWIFTAELFGEGDHE